VTRLLWHHSGYVTRKDYFSSCNVSVRILGDYLPNQVNSENGRLLHGGVFWLCKLLTNRKLFRAQMQTEEMGFVDYCTRLHWQNVVLFVGASWSKGTNAVQWVTFAGLSRWSLFSSVPQCCWLGNRRPICTVKTMLCILKDSVLEHV